jgi:hypothetical protein
MKLNRRSFMERLSLGAGAGVLSAMLRPALAEAQGKTGARKRFVVVSFSNGAWWDKWIPKEFAPNPKDYTTVVEPALSTTQYTLPEIFQPLEPIRNSTLILDGLVNRMGFYTQHTAYNLLTAVPKVGPVDQADYKAIGGPSFDQFLAPVLGRDMPFSDVHLGAKTNEGGEPPGKLASHIFARAASQPIPVQLAPADAFKMLFPLGAGGGAPAPSTDLLQKRRLLDYLKGDVKRVQSSLAGAERAKLDEYLDSLDQAQKRVMAFEQRATVACGASAPDPARVQPAVEADDTFEVQMDLATSALVCGITNIATVSFIAMGAAFFKRFGFTKKLHDIGHNQGAGARPETYLQWYVSLVVKMAQRLAAVREGDGSMLDNTVILFGADNNEQHHSDSWRVPLLLVGNAGRALKVDGRYQRFPALRKNQPVPGGPPGMRCVADLLCTLGHALGAPVDDWAKTTGRETVNGPIADLLA